MLVLLFVVTLPLVTLSALTIMQNVRLVERAATECARIERATLLAYADIHKGDAVLALPPTALAWRLLPGRDPQPLTAASVPGRLPARPADVLSHTEGVRARSVDGDAAVYATGRLPSGDELLLAVPATADLARADRLLGQRLAEIALVLLVSFLAVAYGADRIVADPIRKLGRAVELWRAGGTFPRDPGDLMTGEVEALWQSFAQAAAAVSKREAQLREATAQQELLMQEIHHRVKNNLQIVASLLNLQANRIRIPAARAEFQAARDRIRALATLHRHLYAHGQLHTINMRGFLVELCEQLLAALGETPAGGRISLEIEATEIQISSDQAVPIALIVTEAVSNATKYAFPGGRSGHISVRLTVEADHSVAYLRIADDGVGIPAGKAMTETGMRDGLGLNLIRGFARQLGARVEIGHEGGTRYDIAIPLSRERDPAVADVLAA